MFTLQLSSTQLGSTFESTAELNYLGRPKLALGSAHENLTFDIFTHPVALEAVKLHPDYKHSNRYPYCLVAYKFDRV